MIGLIIENFGFIYKIEYKNKIFNSILKNKVKYENKDFKTPIAIGDKVRFEISDENNLNYITEIIDRENFISRTNPFNSKKQIIAANIDLAILVTIPDFKSSNLMFIDKFLLSTEYFNIKPFIIFNKVDKLNLKELSFAKSMINKYKKIGYDSILSSTLKNINVNKIKKVIQNKTTLLTGNSGVGKSTIINTLIPNVKIKTQNISKKEKGKHTTTNSKMYLYKNHTYLIDTPGIQSIYPGELKKNDIYKHFIDIEKYSKCKFYNCIHINEPGCNVINAKNKGLIEKFRYDNYKKIINQNFK